MVWQSVRRFLRNPYFARTSNDRIAVLVLLFGAHLALWYESVHVLSHYHPSPSNYLSSISSTLNVLAAATLYINSLANLYKMIRTRTACDLTAVGQAENPSWPYCEHCLVHRPPRTHHCPVCDVCVLRRDHHCWFAGSCVGHANQRYYVCAVGYMFLAAIYSNVYHFYFVMDRLGHLGPVGLPICVTLPHVCAVFGFLSFYEFLIAMLTFVAGMLLLLLAWLAVVQAVQIVTGQTRHERKNHDETYNNGMLENVRSVFGKRWYVAWIWPWITSPLPENGVVFKHTERKSK